MKIQLTRSLWGVTDSWETCFPRFKRAGYSLIESPLPPIDQRARFQNLLAEHGLGYVALIYTSGNTLKEHIESFKSLVCDALTLRPVLINSQDGRDAFDEADAIKYFKAVLTIEPDLGLTVTHETHRTRIFYNPWVTRRMLERFPAMKLCADYSHWVVVAERLLQDCEDIMQLCAERCLHIHARVGYEEGPQTPDPRAPEYARHLEAHERWWKQACVAQAKRGHKTMTLTPEFGSPNYLHTLPYTNTPVADLESICDWVAHREAKLLASRR